MRPQADLKAPARAIAAMPRSGIREVMELASRREGVLHLEVGEPDFPTPAHIVEAAARAAAEGYTKYTPNRGLGSVVEAICDKLSRRNGIAADPEHRQRRDVAVGALRDNGLLVSAPRGAFYILADVVPATDDTYAFARALVADHAVAVAPGDTFGHAGRGLVRLSLASATDVIEEGIARLATAVEGWPVERHGSMRR